ncbi:MAG: hypothetical protein IKT88_05410 [Lachnospiraceae bacterium]|nr:hypothetical protein [Lachnospiraceae bacterium]MBR5583991.1 hypothetical protein [Lachnospiraceae bacterium]
MSRRLFFLIACTLAVVTVGLAIITGIKTIKITKQYESSMDRIHVIEEQLVELHTQVDEMP